MVGLALIAGYTDYDGGYNAYGCSICGESYLMREDNTKECPQCGITSSGWISGENIAICPSCDGSGETIEYIPCEHGFTETHSYCSHGYTLQHD